MIPAFLAVFTVSLLSLLGALFLIVKRSVIMKVMTPLLAASSGVLIGTAFFDLIPEGLELIGIDTFQYVVIGILSFFTIEKLLRWHHHVEGDHPHEEKQTKAIGYLSLIGDAIHNFIDGVIIGSSFLVSIPLGISVTLAVIVHEIPHELADFTILLHSGFSNKKALMYNFLSATTAIAGTLLVFWVSQIEQSLIPYLIPFGAGNFLYIAMSDLLPALHKPHSKRMSFLLIMLLIAGVYLVRLLPHE